MIDFDTFELIFGAILTTAGLDRLSKNNTDGLGITFAIAGINSLLDGGKGIWG
tara:strand:- start:558 stop:716 length:159 start_codon:yes stop_codon:yes gene_type:complete